MISHASSQSNWCSSTSSRISSATAIDGWVSLSWMANCCGKRGQRAARPVEQMLQDVLQRAGHEEVLLQQPQPLAGLGFVVGVEHLGDRLRDHLLVDGLVVVAGVEGLQARTTRRPARSTGVSVLQVLTP